MPMMKKIDTLFCSHFSNLPPDMLILLVITRIKIFSKKVNISASNHPHRDFSNFENLENVLRLYLRSKAQKNKIFKDISFTGRLLTRAGDYHLYYQLFPEP